MSEILIHWISDTSKFWNVAIPIHWNSDLCGIKICGKFQYIRNSDVSKFWYVGILIIPMSEIPVHRNSNTSEMFKCWNCITWEFWCTGIVIHWKFQYITITIHQKFWYITITIHQPLICIYVCMCTNAFDAPAKLEKNWNVYIPCYIHICAIYTRFTLLAYAPEQIWLPHCIYMFQCTATVLHI